MLFYEFLLNKTKNILSDIKNFSFFNIKAMAKNIKF